MSLIQYQFRVYSVSETEVLLHSDWGYYVWINPWNNKTIKIKKSQIRLLSINTICIQFVCAYFWTLWIIHLYLSIITYKPHHNIMCSYLYICSALFTDIFPQTTLHLILMTYLVKQCEIPRKIFNFDWSTQGVSFFLLFSNQWQQ